MNRKEKILDQLKNNHGRKWTRKKPRFGPRMSSLSEARRNQVHAKKYSKAVNVCYFLPQWQLKWDWRINHIKAISRISCIFCPGDYVQLAWRIFSRPLHGSPSVCCLEWWGLILEVGSRLCRGGVARWGHHTSWRPPWRSSEQWPNLTAQAGSPVKRVKVY